MYFLNRAPILLWQILLYKRKNKKTLTSHWTEMYNHLYLVKIFVMKCFNKLHAITITTNHNSIIIAGDIQVIQLLTPGPKSVTLKATRRISTHFCSLLPYHLPCHLHHKDVAAQEERAPSLPYSFLCRVQQVGIAPAKKKNLNL